MKLVKSGKTKDVYDLEDGSYLFKFKDSATVDEDGNFDPGGNKVGLSIEGMGNANLRLTEYLYKKIEKSGILTHLISADVKKGSMTVRPAVPFGEGLEVICRFKAFGSFVRRYGKYVKEGQALPEFVEITIKDDDRGDPPITKEGLDVLGILTPAEYDEIVKQTKKISLLIKDELAAKGMELYDIKLEFGRSGGKIILIDEIAAGSMRAYKGNKQVGPMELVEIMLLSEASYAD